MATLNIKVRKRVLMTFDQISLSFTRNKPEVKSAGLVYYSATGQTVAQGEVLYSQGTAGTVGYLAVKSAENATLVGNGVLPITVENYPSATQSAGQATFVWRGGNVTINITYASTPDITDVVIQIDSREIYEFKSSDFVNAYNDFDGDVISEVALFGDVTGLEYYEMPYVAGTWIPILEISNLVYKALPQDEAYGFTNTWKAKDVTGYISN